MTNQLPTPAELAAAMALVAEDPEFRQQAEATNPNCGSPIEEAFAKNHALQAQHPERFAQARKGLYAL